MKALTLWQPWAQLVAQGRKSIETRCWSTDYRGPLAIHAAAKRPPANATTGAWYTVAVAAGFPALSGRIQWPAQMAYGAVIGIGELVDVVPILRAGSPAAGAARHITLRPDRGQDLVALWDHGQMAGAWAGESPFGDFTPGRYAWILRDVAALEHPVTAAGTQGLWTWDAPDGCLTESSDGRLFAI